MTETDDFLRTAYLQGQYSDENMAKNDRLGSVLSDRIKKNDRLNIMRWEPNNELYPRYMLLGTDRGILAYLAFFHHISSNAVSDDVISKYGICHELSGLKARLALVDSDLDRPVFYVHLMEYPNLQGIYFETTEMIKNNLFEQRAEVADYQGKKYYFSNLEEMGPLEELIEILRDLKKNNVRMY